MITQEDRGSRFAVRYSLSAVRCPLSEISYQRSAISDQLPTISDQLSAISDRRTAISGQRSAIGGQRSAISGQRSYDTLGGMNEETAALLLDLNRKFYGQFAGAFAQTRRRVQDGARRALAQLPDEGGWVDLGCGSGALAQAWIRSGRKSHYLGLDFSVELLQEAQRLVGEDERVTFRAANLGDERWTAGLDAGGFCGVLAFAVLHHLPSAGLREHVLRQIYGLLKPGGWFVHSEWQFQHSPKLMLRRLPWERIGLSEMDVEGGDSLLDWRFALPGQSEQIGLRYVHLFSRVELDELAAKSGFEIVDSYESDGEGGRLGLYQVWKARE